MGTSNAQLYSRNPRERFMEDIFVNDPPEIRVTSVESDGGEVQMKIRASCTGARGCSSHRVTSQLNCSALHRLLPFPVQ